MTNWHPYPTEKPPKVWKYYMCTYYYDDEKRVHDILYTQAGFSALDHQVIAWMELPKPFEGEREYAY